LILLLSWQSLLAMSSPDSIQGARI
jgi:hypothetical protein